MAPGTSLTFHRPDAPVLVVFTPQTLASHVRAARVGRLARASAARAANRRRQSRSHR